MSDPDQRLCTVAPADRRGLRTEGTPHDVDQLADWIVALGLHVQTLEPLPKLARL
ncbi:MAG: hypothetical protein ACI9MC_000895 [Kiritimatiellia bacterium]|jgi:hypothetical protein